jgi:hypothetical protein
MKKMVLRGQQPQHNNRMEIASLLLSESITSGQFRKKSKAL